MACGAWRVFRGEGVGYLFLLQREPVLERCACHDCALEKCKDRQIPPAVRQTLAGDWLLANLTL